MLSPLQLLESITQEERLAFSQTFTPDFGNSIGNVLFPNVKTQNAEAEYFSATEGSNIPVAANVHALDTEAYIGSRDDFERVVLSPFFIKEKINQGENLRKTLRKLGSVNGFDEVSMMFDDFATRSQRVAARADVMKHELLATGQITVNENGVDKVVDYGVPATNKIAFTWSGATNTFNPLQDIRNAARKVRASGYEVNTMVMSQAAYDVLSSHPALATALGGTLAEGRILDDTQVQEIVRRVSGISRIIINEERYRRQIATVRDGEPKYQVLRKFKEDSISFCYTNANGAVGVGIWGVTPEEEAYQAFDSYSETGPFVTVTQWYTPDPVAIWTKASALHIPALPAVENQLVIATVALPTTP